MKKKLSINQKLAKEYEWLREKHRVLVVDYIEQKAHIERLEYDNDGLKRQNEWLKARIYEIQGKSAYA